MALSLALLTGGAAGFYLPGVAPRDYQPGERVDLKVNKLTSTKTQLPYEYYALPFCQPDTVENVAENLGEVLRGDRIMNSNYDLKMGVEETCKILCRKELTSPEIKEFTTRIEEDYRIHWVMDNLPSATKYVDETNPNKPVTIYDLGFPLGFRGTADIPGTKEGVSYLNNHLLITVKYHKDETFEVRCVAAPRACRPVAWQPAAIAGDDGAGQAPPARQPLVLTARRPACADRHTPLRPAARPASPAAVGAALWITHASLALVLERLCGASLPAQAPTPACPASPL
eukprot:7080727-Prymnesium_polylepis.1